MGLFFSSLFSSLFGRKEVRVLILGLDNAGKTTILYRLQVDEPVTTVPTIGFNVETLRYKNIKFQVWDLGGQTSIRPYWRCYYPNTDAIIFVVDSTDVERLELAKAELFALLDVSWRGGGWALRPCSGWAWRSCPLHAYGFLLFLPFFPFWALLILLTHTYPSPPPHPTLLLWRTGG